MCAAGGKGGRRETGQGRIQGTGGGGKIRNTRIPEKKSLPRQEIMIFFLNFSLILGDVFFSA